MKNRIRGPSTGAPLQEEVHFPGCILTLWGMLSDRQKRAMIPLLLDKTPSWHVVAMNDISAINWIKRQLKLAGL